MEKFISGFLRDRGLSPKGMLLAPIAGDGSARAFWRITPSGGGPSFIIMANPPEDQNAKRENVAYVMIGRHLHAKKVPVPEIYRFDLDNGWFLMEDMGPASLQDMVASLEDPLPLYEKVLGHLFRFQIEGVKGFDPSWCAQTERYDRYVMRRYETDYFRDAFLIGYLGLKREWPELEDPFNHLAQNGAKADSRFFLHRDFQSRNIMIKQGRIGILDWQGGRLGPLGYDLASLILDPYTNLRSHLRARLYHVYLDLIRDRDAAWIEPFETCFPYLAIQRNLQILGAFAFLTKVRGKTYFEAYIPAALGTLSDLLHRLTDPKLYPLEEVIGMIPPPAGDPSPRILRKPSTIPSTDG